MFKSTGRSLMISAGAWLISMPGLSMGGGLHGFHHHHSPRDDHDDLVHDPDAGQHPDDHLARPGVNVRQSGAVLHAGPGVNVVNLVPSSAMTLVPASSLANASPLSALAAANYTPALNTSSAMAASLNQAAVAHPPRGPGAALASFPGLAQAAQGRGFDGGRFVVFLKNFTRTVVAGLGGQTAVKSTVKTLLVNLISSQLGPLSGGLVDEVEKILGEAFEHKAPARRPPRKPGPASASRSASASTATG